MRVSVHGEMREGRRAASEAIFRLGELEIEGPLMALNLLPAAGDALASIPSSDVGIAAFSVERIEMGRLNEMNVRLFEAV